MKRYTRSIRLGGRSRGDRTREQFSRDLIREAERLLQNLSQQYIQDLNAQTTQLLQQIVSASPAAAGQGTQAAPQTMDSLFGNIGQLLATTVRYFAIKPRSDSSSRESTRSQEIEARFRLSQTQALAEANTAISKGNKNL